MSIEKILSSKGRVRILAELARNEEGINISRIVRKTGLCYRAVSKYLREFAEEELVKEIRYGRMRVFKLNTENPIVLDIKRLLTKWD